MRTTESAFHHAYRSSPHRRPATHVAAVVGWSAAVLLDHIISLEARFALEHRLQERDGRLWLYRDRKALCDYMHIGKDALQTLVDALLEHGYLEKRMMGDAHGKTRQHWSVNLEACAPQAGNPPTQDEPRRETRQRVGGKPANAASETVYLREQNKETPSPSPEQSSACVSPALPGLEPTPSKGPKLSPEVSEVWECYTGLFGPKDIQAKYGTERIKRHTGIARWLKQDGNTVEKARRLILGLSRSQWHLDNHRTGIHYALRESNEDAFLALSARQEAQTETASVIEQVRRLRGKGGET